MKKIISIVFSILLLCALILPYFKFNNKNSEQTSHAATIEESLQNKTDIISIRYDEQVGTLKDVTLSSAPFDSNTKKLMDGNSITPKTTTYNQIENVRISVAEFEISNSQSIYMWIFLPDDPLYNLYSLSISFYGLTNSEYITWKFSPTELSDFMKYRLTKRYGWKLLELSYNDAEKKNVDKNTTFSFFEISYKIMLSDLTGDQDLGVENYLTNGELSIYHVFVADSYSSSLKSSFISDINYYSYSIKSDIDSFDNLILDDKCKIKSALSYFDYIYVGKSNLLKLSESDAYDLEMKLIYDDENSELSVYEGEEHSLTKKGSYTFKIELKQSKRLVRNTLYQIYETDVTIFTYSKSFYIRAYNFGTFKNGLYELDAKKTITLNFRVKGEFQINGIPNFVSTDENIIEIKNVSFNEITGEYDITVYAKRAGRASVKATANGIRPGENIERAYSNSTTVEAQIISENYSGLKKFIFTILIIYVIASIIFFGLTLKNIKKNNRLRNRQ